MTTTDRVAEQIKTKIRNGIYPKGSQLASRHTLMTEYGIARATADKVVHLLISEGYLSSHRGRGTYVNDHIEVLDGLPSDGITLTLVMNSITNAIENDFLSKSPPSWSKGIDHVMGTKDVPKHLETLLHQDKQHVIWSLPPFFTISHIHLLEEANVPQVLLNRRFPDYNYFSNDTESGILMALQLISTWGVQIKASMMSSPLDPGLPYLSEREIAFHESTLKCEVENMGTFRMKSYSKGHRAESCQRVMASGANVVYVNDFDCAESMLAAIEESSLTLGEDIFVITMDWLQKNNVPKGMVSIQQNYGLMLEKAIEWAQTDPHSRIQALIVPDLVHNMGIGSFQGG